MKKVFFICILVSFALLNLFSSASKKLSFSHMYSIYSVDTDKQELSRLTGEQVFSKDYYRTDNQEFYLAASGSLKMVVKRANNKLIPVIEGDIGSFYYTANHIVTISKTQDETGSFTCMIYREENGIFNLQKDFGIKLFVSDYAIVDEIILFSGTSPDNSINQVYTLDLKDYSYSQILETSKTGDFLKIITGADMILIYPSSMPGANVNTTYSIDIPALLKTPENCPVTAHDVKGFNQSFFGKGFYYNGDFLIPVMDMQFNIKLYRYLPSSTPALVTELPTGIYKFHKREGNLIMYTGYNHFKAQGVFYYICFDLKKNVLVNQISLY